MGVKMQMQMQEIISFHKWRSLDDPRLRWARYIDFLIFLIFDS